MLSAAQGDAEVAPGLRTNGGTAHLSVSAIDASSSAGSDTPLLTELASEPDISPLMARGG